MPIVLSGMEWARINHWKEIGNEDPETVRRREYVEHLNKTSKQMTKSWPNSLENVNKRNEELRAARILAAEQANEQFYKKYMMQKEEEQHRLMESARDTFFKNKDAPKLLLSAVIETMIQKEREEQLKFKAERKHEEDEMKRKDDDYIIDAANAWNERQKQKRQKRFQVNKKHQIAIVEQAHEISERNRREYEEELRLQQLDRVRAAHQIQEIKQFENDYALAEKARILRDMERSHQELDQRKREQRARDEMDDKLIEVLVKSRCRIEKKRAETEKEAKAERLRVLAKISAKLESGESALKAKEDAILQKSIKQREQAEQERRDADERKKQRILAERLASREEFLLKEKRQKHEQDTKIRWQLMNRFKNDELNEEFKERLRAEKERKTQEHKEHILRLWKERSDREAKELAEKRYFYGELAERSLRNADQKVLRHIEALIDEAKSKGRPVLPLLRARDRYCGMYRLYPMPNLPKSQQEHFHRYATSDRSLIEGQDPHEGEEDDRIDKRMIGNRTRTDGLQDIQDKVMGNQNSEVDNSYKKQGPANGLQQRPHKVAGTVLPPIQDKQYCDRN